jgi:hypothetical protein
MHTVKIWKYVTDIQCERASDFRVPFCSQHFVYIRAVLNIMKLCVILDIVTVDNSCPFTTLLHCTEGLTPAVDNLSSPYTF